MPMFGSIATTTTVTVRKQIIYHTRYTDEETAALLMTANERMVRRDRRWASMGPTGQRQDTTCNNIINNNNDNYNSNNDNDSNNMAT